MMGAPYLPGFGDMWDSTAVDRLFLDDPTDPEAPLLFRPRAVKG